MDKNEILLTRQQIRELLEKAESELITYFGGGYNPAFIEIKNFYYQLYDILNEEKIPEFYDKWQTELKDLLSLYIYNRFKDGKVWLTPTLRHIFYRHEIFIKGNENKYEITPQEIDNLIFNNGKRLLKFINKKTNLDKDSNNRTKLISLELMQKPYEFKSKQEYQEYKNKYKPYLALWITGWIQLDIIPLDKELRELLNIPQDKDIKIK